MIRRAPFIHAVLLASVTLLAGCAAVGKPQQETVLRIDPAAPNAPATPLSGRLALGPVTSAGATTGRRYAYVDRSAPREVRQAATLFWEEPPAAMVERALLRGLTARLGAPVLPTGLAPGAPRRLSVRLDRFEEQAGAGAEALVALDVVVVAANAPDPVLAGRYCARAPIAGAAASQRSAAFEAALGRVMDALAADLARPPTSARPAAQAAC